MIDSKPIDQPQLTSLPRYRSRLFTPSGHDARFAGKTAAGMGLFNVFSFSAAGSLFTLFPFLAVGVH